MVPAWAAALLVFVCAGVVDAKTIVCGKGKYGQVRTLLCVLWEAMFQELLERVCHRSIRSAG